MAEWAEVWHEVRNPMDRGTGSIGGSRRQCLPCTSHRCSARGARGPAERTAVIDSRGGGRPALENSLGRHGKRPARHQRHRIVAVHRLVIPGEVFSPQGTDHGVDRHGRPFHRERRGAPNVTCTARAHPALFQRTYSRRVPSFLVSSPKKGERPPFARQTVKCLRWRPIRSPGQARFRRQGRGAVPLVPPLQDLQTDRSSVARRRTELAETRRVGDDERRRDVKDFQETCCT
jgi:hypothetical protein